MTTDIVKNGSDVRSLSTDLVNSLVAGIANSRASTPLVGGKPILRLLKDGQWVFGQSDDPVQTGSRWAVNPLSIKHGYCVWSDYPGNVKNELLGEKMVPVSEPKPERPEDIKGFPWKEQRTFDLRCINGEDEGVEVFYKGASVGALNAFDAFAAKLIRQLQFDDPSHPVAVINLGVDSYQHSKWGLTYIPVFDVCAWATMSGDMYEVGAGDPGEDEDEPEAAQTPKPAPQPAPPPPPQPQPVKPPLNADPARPGGAPRRQRPVGRI